MAPSTPSSAFLHFPRGWLGWLATLAFVLFVLQVFVAVDGRSHSVSDTLYGVFPDWGVAFLLWQWLLGRLARS